jgi:hypothetical protein
VALALSPSGSSGGKRTPKRRSMSSSLTSEFRCGVVPSRYRLPMTQGRLSNIVSAVALVVVAAVWLWFLFAYADLILRR